MIIISDTYIIYYDINTVIGIKLSTSNFMKTIY